MRILITGAKGQVGNELVRQGHQLGYSLWASDREDLDITNKNEVEEAVARFAPQLVINAAAHTAVDDAEGARDLAYAINRDGPANLAMACAAQGIPLWHISTDYVFDGTKTTPYTEEDTPNPLGVYGASKLAGDREVERILPQHIILRVAWVFGAAGQNFVRTMLRLGKEREQLRIVADQRGGPTWAGDIASLLLTLAQRYQANGDMPWGSYHYAGAPSTSWHGFAQEIFRQATQLGLITRAPILEAIPTHAYPTPARRPANSELNCNKLAQAFHIAQPDWRLGLNAVLTEWTTP